MFFIIIKNNIKFFFLAFLLSSFELSYADLKNKSNQIIWQKNYEIDVINNEIKWSPIDNNKIFRNKTYQKKMILDEENRSKFTKYYSSFQIEFGPLIPLNNFMPRGSFANSFTQKSSFGGGDAGGTGNQIYSYRVDKGISDSFLISFFITEADDPFYSKIKKKDYISNSEKNYWRQYALYFLKNVYRDKNKNLEISFSTSLELWQMDSYYKNSNEVF